MIDDVELRHLTDVVYLDQEIENDPVILLEGEEAAENL